ncbi:MAG TPA: CHAT domain-containing protein [Terriglobales bacterium]|nr:CHAT domain-containing protein [Terriglobales bacterium]
MFDAASKAFLRGDLKKSQDECHRARLRFESSSPQWAWKFRILEAESLLWRGMSREAITLLSSQPASPAGQDDAIEVLAIEGVAYARLHSFADADRSLGQAEKLCTTAPDLACGGVPRAEGVLAIERGQFPLAREYFAKSLSFAREHGDRFLEASAFLNLGVYALKVQHFDEAVDWTQSALQSSDAIEARGLATKALGNLGWAYYNLGDAERSLTFSEQAEQRAVELSNVIDQLSYLSNAAYVYAEQQDFSRAKQSYGQALHLADEIASKQHIYNSERALALVSVETGDLADARKYSSDALALAQADHNQLDELYPLLVQGLIAAASHEPKEAERIFREVERDPNGNASLKWRAEHGLARLYEDEQHDGAADREYRAALATFEAARDSLRRNDSRLPFSSNASRIYNDYLNFLIVHGRADDALRWADYSRARALAEGLASVPKPASAAQPLNPRQIARQAQAAVLFYWLGTKHSYLWAITARKTSLFSLPPGAEIDAAVQRYRKALAGPQDVMEASDNDGQWLYRTLISPAAGLLTKDARVLVVPDGSLNNLNFETLLVPASQPESRPHYWIEDVTIANASSLRVLGADGPGREKREARSGKEVRSLLLVGNSIAPNDKYPELAQAATQMENVARHFPATAEQILSRGAATPAAYMASNPGQFFYIHFVAHGTASRLSPLDSAVVLSNGPATAGETEGDSFKLYARDIIRYPLRAQLVTVAACYGQGERSYAGEGLVGLSWAFLRAGARNVIAALWEVTDASTVLLMDRFYDGLNHGASPDAALRAAKLSLLHHSAFRNPFYWAPFQLYSRLG